MIVPALPYGELFMLGSNCSSSIPMIPALNYVPQLLRYVVSSVPEAKLVVRFACQEAGLHQIQICSGGVNIGREMVLDGHGFDMGLC